MTPPAGTASLAMYNTGDCVAATDRLWALIRDGLRAKGQTAPDALVWGPDAYWSTWLSADLILAHTCSLPFRTRQLDRVAYVGTLDYGVADCEPGYYRSVLVARADDPRGDLAAFDGARFAFNEDHSQSGWASPIFCATAANVSFAGYLRSGSHLASARAVADGRADLAGIDAITWRNLCRNLPDLSAGLRIVDQTDATPGLPLITHLGADVGVMFGAVERAVAELDATDRATLGLCGVLRLPAQVYLDMHVPPTPAHFGVPD